MRRSTTFVGTKRPVLGFVLLAELILAGAVLVRVPHAPPPPPPAAAPPSLTTSTAAATTETLRDGRTVRLLNLGGPPEAPLLMRVAAEMNDAADAVTSFWGADWPRGIVIVATGSDAELGTLASAGPDVAATTTAERITFAPGAVAMSDASLRIVVRHELFHYAARARTAADAPTWLTEGVADFVGRPAVPRPPPNAADLAVLPTDADLGSAGPQRSLAYDRAWWFSRFVADRYGTPTLRKLYVTACGPGHPDVATAVRDVLGTDLTGLVPVWRRWLSG